MKSDLDPRYKAVLKQVEDYCMKYEDPLIVDKYARFFREGYDAFGLEEEQIHTLRDTILEQNQFSVEELAELGWHLLATGKYEYGSVAIMLLKKIRPKFNRTVFDWVRKWFDKGVENWAHSDVLCSKITPIFLELEIATLQDFESWRSSESKWTRRAVPVTMLYLIKTTEPEILLDFIEPLMDDSDRVVHQGLGWFLRELWKLHRIPTENFLNKHKDHCPRLIIQYATEKMNPDKKAHFAKTKVPNSQNRFNKKNKDRHQQHTGADPVRKVTKNDTAPRKKVETHTPKPKALKPNRIKP